MNPQTTYTFAAAGSSNFYQWMPRITVKAPGRQACYIVTEATYRRFVHLANSGRYHVAIADEEGVAWTLSRKPQAVEDDYNYAAENYRWHAQQAFAAYDARPQT